MKEFKFQVKSMGMDKCPFKEIVVESKNLKQALNDLVYIIGGVERFSFIHKNKRYKIKVDTNIEFFIRGTKKPLWEDPYKKLTGN